MRYTMELNRDTYRGYSIDICQYDMITYLVYDNVTGNYIDHEPMYSLDECKAYIDNITDNEQL